MSPTPARASATAPDARSHPADHHHHDPPDDHDPRSDRTSDETGDRTRWEELRWAAAGGLFATGGVFAAAMLVGRVDDFEARRMVEGMKPTATFAASTYVGAGATILALMATMISFSITHDSEFRRSHYQRLRIVAAATTALIVVSLALLTVLVAPIGSGETPGGGYVGLYWTILGLGSLGAGLTVMIVLMLNYTVRGLIDLGIHGSSALTFTADDDGGAAG